jgi:uncharacterized protein DUF1592/uncharacterized protein DUF1588/uncharacterized protein DUF1587/uncharacterized protein DUF1595/uncharacterized protein DUF1585
MQWFVQAVILIVVAARLATAQAVSFADHIYPVLEAAGCRNCHSVEGVASPTRLRFPNDGVSRARVDAFGLSLVEFIARQAPEKSLLLVKPTARIQHTGGERIVRNSPEEAALRSWIGRLAMLSGAELARALDYRKQEAAGYGVAPKVVLRRLTQSQYNNTVRDLLKDTSEVAHNFPPEDYVDGFKNQYEALSISPLLAEAYGIAAEKLAANAFRRGDSRGLIPCRPTSETDAACRIRFVETFGRKAFRRPLEHEEIQRYDAIFRKQKTFLTGAQAVIEAMLQSPGFLFWLEETPNPKWKPYARASTLSYFLWNTTPDEALLASAEAAELNTPESTERVARRMLDNPKARDGVNEFVAQWLRFDRVIAASRERRLYPLFNAELARSMTEESRRFIDDLVWNERNFMEAFTAGYSFLNSDLAAVYKVSPPARDFDRVELPPSAERAGILGHASFLTLTSKPDDTAPTGRGLFIREQFLCQHVPPPPPGVDTNLPPVEETKPVTNRDRLAMHTTNQMCVGCHNLIDPVGFGFEKFDAIGMRREKHKLLFFQPGASVAARRAPPKSVELEIDTKGWVAGLESATFASPRELGQLLARTPQCQECVVKQVFRYMAGRQDSPADRAMISGALAAFRASGFHFRELMVFLVKYKDGLPGGSLHAARNHQP